MQYYDIKKTMRNNTCLNETKNNYVTCADMDSNKTKYKYKYIYLLTE